MTAMITRQTAGAIGLLMGARDACPLFATAIDCPPARGFDVNIAVERSPHVV
jgi:hypothetical protein